ncbi:MAG: lactoylglutathione lyase [Rhabdochlamydiaceae bacterium]|nr:lactoylglutathione lyase [Candidatus Amphrikana amoebophyrae]
MKILHTMIRVEDLDRSIKFYQEVLNMRLLKRKDYPHGEFTLAFMGYQEISDGPTLELTYNWDKRKYDIGSGYGHIAISVINIYEMCEKVVKAGFTVSRAPGPMKGSTSILAFIEDPDGYKIELIERK